MFGAFLFLSPSVACLVFRHFALDLFITWNRISILFFLVFFPFQLPACDHMHLFSLLIGSMNAAVRKVHEIGFLVQVAYWRQIQMFDLKYNVKPKVSVTKSSKVKKIGELKHDLFFLQSRTTAEKLESIRLGSLWIFDR